MQMFTLTVIVFQGCTFKTISSIKQFFFRENTIKVICLDFHCKDKTRES